MKKIILLLPILFITFLLTGCYDYKILNDLGMVGALAIDKEGDDYIVTIQFLYMQSSPSGSSPTGQAQPTTFSGRGKSINSAAANIALILPKRLCFSHLQLVIVQESVAKEGMINVLDFIIRHYESRMQFPLIISREPTAGEILNVQTAMENFPTLKIVQNLTIANDEHGLSNELNYDQLVSYILKGENPTLSSIKIINRSEEEGKKDNIEYISPKTQLQIDTLGVFKKDKLLGWLDYDETLGYNLSAGKIKKAVIAIPCKNLDKDYSSIRMLSNKASVDVEIKNNEPKIKIEVKPVARITELQCNLGSNYKQITTKMEKLTNEEIKRLVEATLKTSQQKFNSDIFGIGDLVYRKNPKYWKKNKANWDKIYPTLDYEVKVDTNISIDGIINKTIIKNR